MIIAIDFDGTIAKWGQYPEIGEIVPYAKIVINHLYASGHEIIIWSCRGPLAAEKLAEWLVSNGINYHSINQQGFDTSFDPSPKLIADLYIDDKSPFMPLIPNEKGKPYVDWLVMELWLKKNGYYTILLGD